MLRGKYKRYQKLYLYAIDGCDPEFHHISDEDFIGCWEEEDLCVLFFHQPKDNLVEKLLAKKGLKLETKACVDFENWGEGRRIKPFSIGPYTFAPEWFENKTNIKFDPGVVFGSGNHPTTRLCLESVYELWQKYGPFNQIADLGCGSGLISLLAAHLGANVLAVDRNPLCVALTKKNAYINGLSSKIKVIQADVKKLVPYKADLIVANLYKGLLLELFGLPSFWKNPYYLFSGFVLSMEKELQQALDLYGEIIFRKESNSWVLYAVKSKNIFS